MTPQSAVEHSFRHDFGPLVSSLAVRFGLDHLEAIEDAVQEALLAALESWPRASVPEKPTAWLYRVAHNRLTSELRTATRRRQLLTEAPGPGTETDPEPAFSESEIRDDLLRMLFVCCDPALPVDTQLVLSLKILSGFSVKEIALRLFTSEANVYKRLARGRAGLAALHTETEVLEVSAAQARLPAVHRVLYVLFTEGYLSNTSEQGIRHEICGEAIRLTTILADHPAGATPATFALLALMHLQAARLEARLDPVSGLLLLDEQDRSRWEPEQIHTGMTWLSRSASGTEFSRYHAEASIAAEHCLAPSLGETRWNRIVDGYRLLERVAPSRAVRLNLALATAEASSPEAGLALLSEPGDGFMELAVHSDLQRRCGNEQRAISLGRTALEAAPSEAIRLILERRLFPARR